jgi:hypothetical protein
MRRSVSFVVYLAWFAAACGGSITEPSGVLAPAVWGGEGIRMTVTATGATIDYGCAVGAINEQLVVDQSGGFTARGTHSFGRGGPREPGDPPLRVHPARYEGTTDGKTMQLAVFLPELSRKVGEFLLERGRPPSLDRCL